MNPPRALRARAVVEALEEAGVTHAVGIPDNTSAPLFDLLGRHPSIRLVTVSREGEAFALASGVWMGGGRPVVIVQGTGFIESGDAIRGTAARMGAPLPVLVTGRGYAKIAVAGLRPGAELTREVAIRPDVDTVALVVEPTLDAWGVPFKRAGSETDVALVISRARHEERPVALILTSPLG